MKNQIIFGSFLAFSFGALAQNVSYNLNTNPIGGVNNSAFGTGVLGANTTGNHNAGSGNFSLLLNTTGAHNAATGMNAMRFNQTGNVNTATGSTALYNNNNGSENTATGFESMRQNISGNSNTADGYWALYNNTTGKANTAEGYRSLFTNTIGNENSALGAFADVALNNLNNATAIGAGAIVNLNDRVWVGNVNATAWTQVPLWNPSDQRFKYSVEENDVKGLEFITLLRPVVYNFDTKKLTELVTKNMSETARAHYLSTNFDKSASVRQSGFLAQEVEEAAKKAGYNFSGLHAPEGETDTYGISYATFVVPLVKAVQEQQAIIKNGEKTVSGLQQQLADQQKQIDALKALVQAVAGNSSKPAAISVNVSDKNVVVLNQNVPNPFAESTVISYNIPADFSKAQIVFSATDGKPVKAVDITVKGKGSLSVFAEDLSHGVYTYSLIVDGRIIDTKKMVKE